jgi:hypothetical protein
MKEIIDCSLLPPKVGCRSNALMSPGWYEEDERCSLVHSTGARDRDSRPICIMHCPTHTLLTSVVFPDPLDALDVT